MYVMFLTDRCCQGEEVGWFFLTPDVELVQRNVLDHDARARALAAAVSRLLPRLAATALVEMDDIASASDAASPLVAVQSAPTPHSTDVIGAPTSAQLLSRLLLG